MALSPAAITRFAFQAPAVPHAVTNIVATVGAKVVLPTAAPGIALATAQLAGALTTNFEAGAMTPYGKFFNAESNAGPKIASRPGMMLIYGPAFAVCAVALKAAMAAAAAGAKASSSALNGREVLIAGMLATHFLKRVLEVLFLHKYSGGMDRNSALGIGLYYALMAKMVLHQQALVPAAMYAAGGSLPFWPIAAFAIGQFGNFYHHRELAKMRKSSDDGYALPNMGLFEYITCPHYFFELMAWWAMAAATKHLNAYVLAFSMTVYLAGRADATREWYAQQFGDDGTLLGFSVRGRARLFPSDMCLFGTCSPPDPPGWVPEEEEE